ncbi:nucleotide-diphospho-sugar transferase [Marivirga sp.]|uniref:nucleotide-diphospho-sugar transferase n=1 Tax=Marivirga sp. TaxID=2018662 RepID=UPI0025CD274D|nr:nucleotide-diphospho-sugar transferase [Marivirga sp.]
MRSEIKFDVPILFLIFNRPGATKKVIDEIKKIRPDQLFIASDGAREYKDKEKEIVEDLRKQVLASIDWECNIKTLFRSDNLGCKLAVSGAIDWFFDNVEQGIILEDDCLPSESFFSFCREMLERYKDEEQIMSICGYNILGSYACPDSYIFSKYFYSWGWATWKHAWQKIDISFDKYQEAKDIGDLEKYYPSFIERKIRSRKIDHCVKGRVNSWAIPWNVSHQMTNSLAIIPKVNLIENIGFSNDFSTHTQENLWDKNFLYHKPSNLSFPLNHPKEVKENKKFLSKFLLRESQRIILKKLKLHF